MPSRHTIPPRGTDPVRCFGTSRPAGRSRLRARRRLPAAVAVLSLLPALSPAAPASATPAPSGAPPARAAGTAPRTVTLITGDRVTVMGQGVSVEPATGRTRVPFLNQNAGGEQHVVPTDALPLLQSGRLDPRLFNITTLLNLGYDTRPKGLPLIVTRPSASPRSAIGLPGLAVTRDLPATNAVAADARAGTALWRSLIARPAPTSPKVWLDARPLGEGMNRQGGHGTGDPESYDLTIKHLDHAGAPATGFLDTVFRMDKPGVYRTSGPGGDTVRLPKGVYTVNSVIGKDQDNLTTLLVQQRLEVTSTQTIVADARQAKPVVVTPPRNDLQWRAAVVGAGFTSPGNAYNFLLQTTSFDQVSVGRMGPDTPVKGFHSFVRGTVLRPGPDGTDADSPAVYHLAWPVQERMITGFTERVEHEDLAEVEAGRAVSTPGGTGRTGTFATTDHGWLGNVAPSLSTRLPFHRTEYFTTGDGLRWHTMLFEFRADRQPAGWVESAPTAYRAGRTYTERWNHAVLGPTLPRGGRPMVHRHGDTLKIETAFSGDSEGRYGTVSDFARSLVVLYRNGVEHGRRTSAMTDFAVPSEPADYKLHISSARMAGELSTLVDVAWTFRSGHVDDGETALLPLWAVRYVPPVDDHGTAEAGREIELPVITESQPGGDAGRLRELSVQMSADDGKTWQDVRVIRTPHGSVAFLRHPAANGFVSLRATAMDSDGNKLEQTIIRAYRIATRP